MRKMYVCFDVHDDHGEIDAFFDESFTLVGIVHGNDGEWRHEYFNPILKHFDLKVERKEPEDIPDYEEKLKQHL